MKECKKCKLSFEVVNFTKRKSTCNDCVLLYGRLYWHANKHKYQDYYDETRLRNKEKIAENRNKNKRQRRLDLLTFMGNKCVHCGIDDIRILQIDHVNGGGRKELMEYRKSSTDKKYLEMIKESVINNENKYQLLCANCNWIKRYTNNEVRGKSVKLT